ncbi:hypothetical protein HOD19_01570, partial [bacterium]|nr:hypothetical protein [bacterium]
PEAVEAASDTSGVSETITPKPEAVEAASDTSGVSETITPKPEAVEAASDTTQVEAPVVTPEAADQFTLDSIMSSENIEDGVEFELEGKIFMKEGGKLLVKAGTKNLEVPDEAAFNRLLNR